MLIKDSERFGSMTSGVNKKPKEKKETPARAKATVGRERDSSRSRRRQKRCVE